MHPPHTPSHRAGRRLALSLLAFLAMAAPAAAQNWSTDARSIALGSGGTEVTALDMAQEQKPYRTVVIPLGLFQVVPKWSVFNPMGADFDPVRALTLAASPMHYTVGGVEGRGADAQSAFITGLVNGEISRDLNAYRGFKLPPQIVAEGLASPSWGKTFTLAGARTGFFHGAYVGAGPYFSVRTVADFDEQLVSLLGSETDVFVRDASFKITDKTVTQLALAVTGGYRARLPFGRGATPTGRDGIYIAADYHHLRGLLYEDVDLTVRFDTDNDALLTLAPASQPLSLDRITSGSGRGFAVDLSLAVALKGWDVGFGANGLGNRIEWRDAKHQVYALESVLDGGEFVELDFPALDSTRRVEQPVDYSANVGYTTSEWSVVSQYSHGYLGNKFRSGLEYRFGAIDVRGGLRFSEDRWHPTVGVGWNLTPRFGLDVAVYGNNANLERRRQPAVAVSLRLAR